MWANQPAVAADPQSHTAGLNWAGFDGLAFQRAKSEQKLVLLSLEAGWCHWCHVMKAETYPATKVQRVLERYVLTRADSDERPDLASRYGDYGWPATIILNEQGQELAALSGYQQPDEFAALLEKLAQTRRPLSGDLGYQKPQAGSKGNFSPEIRRQLLGNFYSHYDDQQGGFGFTHKFVNWDNCEYALLLARQGQPKARKMLHQTLEGGLRLIDPEWGGVYQYSDSGVWTSPHYEKVAEHQAGNLRIYSLAYSWCSHPKYLWAAQKISGYLSQRLQSPQGAFYTSQDADPSGLPASRDKADLFFRRSAAEREKNAPRIDTHHFARENGWLISAQVQYFLVSQDRAALASAERAGRWLTSHLWNGRRFLHQVGDESSHNLLDTLNAAQACLSLYWASGDADWLAYIEPSLIELQEHHQATVGFSSTDLRSSLVGGSEIVLRDDNVALARFCNSYHLLTQSERAKSLRDHALAYLAGPASLEQVNPGGVLLADWEARQAAVKLTVIGPKQWFQQLHPLWGRVPCAHKLITWIDPNGPTIPVLGPCPYPLQPSPRAYLCLRSLCRPVDRAAQLDSDLKRFFPPGQ